VDSTGGIVIYDTGDGQARLDVHLDGETVWLTQAQMAELFGVGPQAITRHIGNIIDEDELVAEATISKMEQVSNGGGLPGQAHRVRLRPRHDRLGGLSRELAQGHAFSGNGRPACSGSISSRALPWMTGGSRTWAEAATGESSSTASATSARARRCSIGRSSMRRRPRSRLPTNVAVTMERRVRAWELERNESCRTVGWQFTT